MSLQDIPFRQDYQSLNCDVGKEFYIPALSEAVLYKRAVGFFSSTALEEICIGIAGLIKNGGKIKLLASPRLNPEDVKAIEEGYRRREEIVEEALIRNLAEDLSKKSLKRLNILANLIALKILDIRIAFTEDPFKSMYHEKLGLISDIEGNTVAFSGSNNETRNALCENYESFDVFCSWNENDSERVSGKEKRFNDLWQEGNKQGIETRRFETIEHKILEKYMHKKMTIPDIENEEREIEKEEAIAGGDSSIDDNLPQKKVYGDNVPHIPENVTLHPYQIEAIQEWHKHGFRGIFDMATGTGKTFTGLGAIADIYQALSGKLAVIICCPYQHLVEQWAEDIRFFGIKPIVGYGAAKDKTWKQALDKSIRDQKTREDKPFFCYVTTNAYFTTTYVQEIIKKIKAPILLIVDEAHNFGAKYLSKLLDDRFQYRLALSATLDRFGDEEGTKRLYDFFGTKCIEYTLERAIDEEKLTKYRYYPVMVYLNEIELQNYEEISYELSKHVTKKNGRVKLDSYGEILAIKRSRIIAAASQKLIVLKSLMEKYKSSNYLLVYCGATNVIRENEEESETDASDVRQIEEVANILGNELGMSIDRFTSRESIEQRASIINHFKNGDGLQGIVAIKCLDEGVNIPGIRTAFILASSTNPKEYIQRRGRVLRLAKGKEYAEIYDFVTLPRPLDEVSGLTADQMKRDLSLVRREMKRMVEFGRLSMNKMETQTMIWQLCEAYHIKEPDVLSDKGEEDYEL